LTAHSPDHFSRVDVLQGAQLLEQFLIVRAPSTIVGVHPADVFGADRRPLNRQAAT
jgi:hypothetical protein